MADGSQGQAASRRGGSSSSPSDVRRPLIRFVHCGDRIIGGPTRRMVRLEERRLLAAAERRTGLSDFGDPAFREPLRRLLESLEGESRLTWLGRLGARTDILQMLVNRLKLARDRARYPEIAQQEIRRPLFITGLPRTGSTFLHGLLAADPTNRVPFHWETREPSPPPIGSDRENDARIARAARNLRWFYRIAPEFRQIHPIEARMPEECVVIQSHAFLSFQFSSTYDVPSYQAWLDEQDLTPAYRYHREFLQHLQSRWSAERWMLKAPPHMRGLDALFAVYPDANVIMTHRDPLEVVASVSSLHFVLRRAFCNGIDSRAVGPEVTAMLADDIRSGLRSRDAGCAPEERFLDVRYADLVRDPLATVRRIYDRFGLPLSDASLAAMRAYLAKNPKDKHGAHVYTLAQFGLDDEVERERYRPYRDRFGV